ncbi:MAG: hypothetical protein JJT96_10900 [Opitutales bacterium]|nr:hypothetical protein [Opitutales bacterium]
MKKESKKNWFSILLPKAKKSASEYQTEFTRNLENLTRDKHRLDIEFSRAKSDYEKLNQRAIKATESGDSIALRDACMELSAIESEIQQINRDKYDNMRARTVCKCQIRKVKRASSESDAFRELLEIMESPGFGELVARTDLSEEETRREFEILFRLQNEDTAAFDAEASEDVRAREERFRALVAAKNAGDADKVREIEAQMHNRAYGKDSDTSLNI